MWSWPQRDHLRWFIPFLLFKKQSSVPKNGCNIELFLWKVWFRTATLLQPLRKCFWHFGGRLFSFSLYLKKKNEHRVHETNACACPYVNSNATASHQYTVFFVIEGGLLLRLLKPASGLRSSFHLAAISHNISKTLILPSSDLCHSIVLLVTCMVMDKPVLVAEPHFSLPLCCSLFPLPVSLIFSHLCHFLLFPIHSCLCHR